MVRSESFRVRREDLCCSFYISVQLINGRKHTGGIEYNGKKLLESAVGWGSWWVGVVNVHARR